MTSASNLPRVMWEMKMECILSHLIGSVDSLLLRINDKLGLGMKIKDVSSSPSSISEIKYRLNKRDREIIPYFEVSIKKTNNLIDDIIKKEPLLAS
jgi:hypothetical protein